MLKVLGKYWQALVVASTVGVVATALIVAPMAALGLSTSVDTTRPGDVPAYFLGETVEITGQVDLNAAETVNKVFLKIEGPEPLDVELPIVEGTGIPIHIPAGTLFADVHLDGVESGGGGYGYGYGWIAPVGGSIHYVLHYTPPIFLSDPEPVSALDFVLVVDNSGSYGDDIATIKGLAPQIRDGILATVADPRFGLATFVDFPVSPYGSAGTGDYAYRLDQDLIADGAAWQAAVNAMVIRYGADEPESQLEALKRVAVGPNAPSWRACDVSRVVALTTDASFHDKATEPSYPGPTFAETVAALNSNCIHVIAIKAPGSTSQMDQIASLTGGRVQTTGSSSAEIVDAITEGLGGILSDQPIVGLYSAKLIAVAPLETITSAPKMYTINKNMDLQVTIDEPAEGLHINTPTGSIPAHGTVNDVTVHHVDVSVQNPGVGVMNVGMVPVNLGVWSTPVPLAEGMNTIIVRAVRNAYSPILMDTAERDVVLDTTVPQVFISGLPSATDDPDQTAHVAWDEPFPADLVVKLENDDGETTLLHKTTFTPGVNSVDVPLTLAEGDNQVIAQMVDLAGNEASSFFDVFLESEPSIESLPTLYPVGEVSARPGKHGPGGTDKPGDPVVFQFKGRAPGDGIEAVVWERPGPPGEDPELVPLMPRDHIPEALLHSFGASPDANYFLVMRTPDVPPGTFSVHVKLFSDEGQMADTVGVAQVQPNLSKFNIYLMPNENLVALPLLNLGTEDNQFDIADLLQQPVENVAGLFQSGLGHPTVLADFVETVFYYTGGDAGVWQGYIPGPAADTMTRAGQSKGYWVKTRAEAFEMFPPVNGLSVETPSPVKLTISGRFLRPGTIVPQTSPVVAGWNLVGLANEEPKPVGQFVPMLSGFRSLIRYRHELDMRGGPMYWGNEYLPVAHYTGDFVNLFPGNTFQPGDSVKPGDGLWLYVDQPGVLTP